MHFYFIGRIGDGQSPTIWRSDGTTANTKAISKHRGVNELCMDPLTGAGAVTGASVLAYFNGKIYAQSYDGPDLLVWDTHPNAQGTSSPVQDWTQDVFNYGDGNPQTQSQTYLNPQLFPPVFSWKGLVYFNGQYEPPPGTQPGPVNLGAAPQDLFSTDGTLHGTHQITSSNLNPSSMCMGPPTGLLYFAGNDSGSGNNVLFTYDGSALPSPAMGIDGPPYNPAYLTQLFAVLGRRTRTNGAAVHERDGIA